MKPNEITDEMLRGRIKLAVGGLSSSPSELEAGLYGFLKDFVGIVGRARQFQRERDAQIARAHTHHQTARIIQKEED